MVGSSRRVVVIGGGAAGFFGAIVCAETHPRAQVELLEAGRSPLTKVSISGGGRCNVTHHCFEPAALAQHYPRGSKALRGAFSRFQAKDTVDWFSRRGVALKTEADGRMFPTTDDSGTIIDCLMDRAGRAGVRLRTGAAVRSLQRVNEGFELVLRSQEILNCDRILLATGSHPTGYALAQSLGHTVISPVPSLFTFNVKDKALQALAGVAVDPVVLTLKLPGQKPLTQTGPLLVTHWGLSGPAVLKLSAWGARPLHESRYLGTLAVNWLPNQSPDNLRQALLTTKTEQAKKLVLNYCPFDLPRRLWQYLVLERANLAETLTWANLPKAGLQALIQELEQGAFAIAGKGVFKDEFVTCGGISLKEIDFKTMESRLCPGLYFAGEILDIDGITGGFNFQNAWTTGWLAGQAMG
ncbi:NAD(P)/FAD-dependent oxidoreductase [Pseudanabaena sp. FACHB-2040]|uniref:NAD(P)/FAD-dependent oxidoreductase n=1 Tax=Pseudanabaena sp. FACHB-2040 TaxID=2692859 RepID=UPI0016842E1A|nr:NAD(P)/FAD-dependent oxidoreductase [Pseudanabaena sp. FACHB-2040]MBD2260020.1 NAD(P)/FAD-dependent oxidoreductase [Pseudanabaena sp. FACHB-2040]